MQKIRIFTSVCASLAMLCPLPLLYFFYTFSAVYWRRQWHPTPVLLPGKSRGRRSLVGCSPWGRKESDTTEQLHFHFLLSCIGERKGNPLQCSCLENPRDGGAWWAAIYGVTQSWIQLKQLSSSSSQQYMAQETEQFLKKKHSMKTGILEKIIENKCL